MKDAGIETTDDAVITKFLMTLPANYDHFSSAFWNSTPTAEKTLEQLTNRLMVEEHRINARKIERGKRKHQK